MAEPITTILQCVGSLIDGMQYILLHEQTRRVVLISTKQASHQTQRSFYTAGRSHPTVYYIRKASCMSCLLFLLLRRIAPGSSKGFFRPRGSCIVFCSTTWFASNVSDAHQAQTSDGPPKTSFLMVIDAQPRVHACMNILL
jgi:hypothetical protein